MIKEFFLPNIRKVGIYLVLAAVFMTEILSIRYLYNQDNIISLVLNIYRNYPRLEGWINKFMMAFFFYIFILAALYIASCFINFIMEKIKK